jgi:membrane-associated phospholipid phosphatase
VSSAFSAAWGLLRFLPEYRWAGWTMLSYAIIVWIATVYGRYHFAVDGLGGLAVSLIALAVAVRLRPVSTSAPQS